MKAMRDDSLGLAANLGMEMLSNEQNDDDREWTTLFKHHIRLYVSLLPCCPCCSTISIEHQGKRLKSMYGPPSGIFISLSRSQLWESSSSSRRPMIAAPRYQKT
jgi:hypothetical protein